MTQRYRPRKWSQNQFLTHAATGETVSRQVASADAFAEPLVKRRALRSNALVDASTAAVVGAAVGAIGGLGGGFLTVLGQSNHLRQQHDGERARWRDEIRRAAYNDMLATTKQLSNALWKAADQLAERESTAAEWQARYEEAHNAWTQFSAAAAAVAIAGPRAVAEAAEELREAMYDWEMVCTAWTHAAISGGVGKLDDFAAQFRAAAEAKRVPGGALQLAARKALGTDD